MAYFHFFLIQRQISLREKIDVANFLQKFHTLFDWQGNFLLWEFSSGSSLEVSIPLSSSPCKQTESSDRLRNSGTDCEKRCNKLYPHDQFHIRSKKPNAKLIFSEPIHLRIQMWTQIENFNTIHNQYRRHVVNFIKLIFPDLIAFISKLQLKKCKKHKWRV